MILPRHAPRPRSRAALVASLAVAAAFGAGCEETIEIGDNPPVVTAVGPVLGASDATGEPADARVFVDYALQDPEFDDAEVVVTVCACTDPEAASSATCVREACGIAIQGIGGDGTSRLPTVPPRDDLDDAFHRFVWDAEAGRVGEDGILASAPDVAYVVGVAVVDADAAPLFSAPFTLDAIGVTLDE